MARSRAQSEKTDFNRTFRKLSREEIADPDKLDALEAMGLGGQFGWDNLLDAQRVLIISAAGAGKTHECREQARKLFADGNAAFFLTLEGVSTTELQFLLEREQYARYRQWLADGHSEAHFFLDSADELLLSHGDFRQALRKLALAIDGQLHRARIVVTSRPIGLDLDAFANEFPVVARSPDPEVMDAPDEPFRRLISGQARKEHHETKKKPDDLDPETGVRIVCLTSLSTSQIEQLAASRGLNDLPALISEIDRKRAWEFARRPQELIEICSYWKEHGKLGTRSEQVAEDIRRKLQEAGERKRHVKLSDAKALDGAERLALAQVLTRKRTIRFSDLSLDAVEQEAAIDPSIILDDWPEPERSELLQRPLFGFASYGRVRFHHRSASEYLAARRLHRLCRDGHMTRAALFRLLFGECYGQRLLFPSMRAVSAWLAIDDDAVRDEVLRREPEALMDDGDPESFPISTRSRILAEYVQRYGKDGWRGVRIPYPQVLRFAAPELSAAVRQLCEAGRTNPEVRELLIDLVQVGRMDDCLDIAAGVANDPTATPSDRVTAITALAELTATGGLSGLVASLLSDARWPSQVKERVFEPLFPKHMSIEQLTQLLGQIEVKKYSVGGVEWTLPRLIPLMKLGAVQIAQFRVALARLIEDGIEPCDAWPHYSSKYSHYSSALAALCLAELGQDPVPPAALIGAAVLASRLRESEYGDEKPGAELISRFQRAPRDWRKKIYLAEGRFCAAHIPARNGDEFGANLTHDTLVGLLDHDDFDWLVEICRDLSVERQTRAAALWDAMFLLCPAGKLDPGRVNRLRQVATGEPDWSKKLDERMRVPKRNKKYEALEVKWKKEAEARKAKEQAAIESWVTWRDEVLSDPDIYFAKTDISRVVWDFAQVLEHDPEERGWRAHWNQTTLAGHFTEAIAERVRAAFCAYWRTIRAPLRSEQPEGERNTVWTKWIYALAGVYAEAEGSEWARRLKRKEAERAARLALVEMNGVPPWVKELALYQPKALDATLGHELSAQLAYATSFAFPGLLADFSRADQAVVEFFAPRVWAWLSLTLIEFDGDQQQARVYDHLERAIDFVLRSSINKSELSSLALRRLDGGLGEPFASLWLVALLSTSPGMAIETLDTRIGELDPAARYRFSENLFASFSDRRSARFCPELSDPRFTPDLLLKLVRLAYAEIRLTEDIERVGTGTYSPTPREEAQDGRSAVLGALLARTGPEAWDIKQAMRSDPLFAHFKDRLDQLARERAAAEAEGPPLSDGDVSSVEKLGEAPQVNRNGMFSLMMDRVADLRHDIATHEFSERSILVGIDKEKDMQIWFAKRLQERENGAYRIDREAMVVNAKETDSLVCYLSALHSSKHRIHIGLQLQRAFECRPSCQTDQIALGPVAQAVKNSKFVSKIYGISNAYVSHGESPGTKVIAICECCFDHLHPLEVPPGVVSHHLRQPVLWLF